jgi:uncharacterized protein (DUF433 family)
MGGMKALDELLSTSPGTLGGEVVFRDTRVPLRALVDYLSGGESLENFLEDFPGVGRETAVAVIEALASQADAAVHAAAS